MPWVSFGMTLGRLCDDFGRLRCDLERLWDDFGALRDNLELHGDDLGYPMEPQGSSDTVTGASRVCQGSTSECPGHYDPVTRGLVTRDSLKGASRARNSN